MDPLRESMKNLQKMTEVLGNLHSDSNQPWSSIGRIQEIFDSQFWEQMMKTTNHTATTDQQESTEQSVGLDNLEYTEEVDNNDAMELFIPNIDLFQTKQKVIVSCEAPGLEKSSLEISLSNGRNLSIKGRIRKHPFESYRVKRERYYGKFVRKIKLPHPVTTEGIKTLYSNGLLEIHFFKKIGKSTSKDHFTFKFGR